MSGSTTPPSVGYNEHLSEDGWDSRVVCVWQLVPMLVSCCFFAAEYWCWSSSLICLAASVGSRLNSWISGITCRVDLAREGTAVKTLGALFLHRS